MASVYCSTQHCQHFSFKYVLVRLQLEESVVSGVQTSQGSSNNVDGCCVPYALQDEELEEWMVTPEEFHQHSDSQAYADNVRPCAEMLFAALLEVHSVASRTCTACDSATCCRSLAVCQLVSNCMAACQEGPHSWRPHDQQSSAVPVSFPQPGKFICSAATWGGVDRCRASRFLGATASALQAHQAATVVPALVL